MNTFAPIARYARLLLHCVWMTLSLANSIRAQGADVTAVQNSVARPRSDAFAELFRVVNPGTDTASYYVSGVCDGPVLVCARSVGYLTLGPSDTALVAVNYRLDTTGSLGSVGVVVTDAQTYWIAFANTDVIAMATTWQPGGVGDRPDLALNERSMCVAASLGAGAAYECGDLRLVHPLPATRVLNKQRAPVLIYNSGEAAPYPIVAAHVVRNMGAVRPDSLSATLRVNGAIVATQRYKPFPTGDTARVAIGFDASGLATHLYSYALEVTAFYPLGSGLPPEVIYERSGNIALVNRGTSRFGRGWWLAGLEQLVAEGPDTKLWVGGDGSTRLYNRSLDDTTFVGPLFSRPDTLRPDPQNPGGFYRTLPGGVRVYFNSLGQHVRTVNALQHTTTFTYTCGALTRVDLPVTGYGYDLNYTGGACGTGPLAEVVAPRTEGYLPGLERTVRLANTGGNVTGIWDPQYRVDVPPGTPFDYAKPHVSFTTTGARITARTDRTNAPLFFRYDSGWRLSGTALPLGAGDSIKVALRAAESQGLSGALAPSAVFTQLDGPRTDVSDVTKLYLDRWGAPVRVVDALGNTTAVRRASMRFPAVVTSVTSPNAREITATYDDRGNMLTMTDWGTQSPVDNRYATTLYEWDRNWDKVARTTTPEGIVTTTQYDTYGRPSWIRAGQDTARTTYFTYRAFNDVTAPNLIDATVLPRGSGQFARPMERYGYDSHGNLALVSSPMGFQTKIFADNAGRDTLVLSPVDSLQTVWQISRTTRDLNDRVLQSETVGPPVPYWDLMWDGSWYTQTRATESLSLFVRNEYDAEGRTLSVRRWSVPDSSQIDTLLNTWKYDAAGRTVAEYAPRAPGQPFLRDSTVYDPAGNAVRVYTRRGHQITMVYDALNRLTTRTVPAVVYPRRTDPYGSGWQFPLYPNDAANGWTIPAETYSYTYDAMGNQLTADNASARVKRSYYPNGNIATDSLWIARYDGVFDTSLHRYGLYYTYDNDGRRLTMAHPGTLTPFPNAWMQTAYAYDEVGQIDSVTDILGNTFTYEYDAAGQLTNFRSPGGILDHREYDMDGRMARRRETASVNWRHNAQAWDAAEPASDIHWDQHSYDARGKLLRVMSYGDSTRMVYDGLGSLVKNSNASRSGQQPTEWFNVDAMSNQRHWVRFYVSSFINEWIPSQFEQGTGRLMHTGRMRGNAGPAPLPWGAGQYGALSHHTDTQYDSAGNRTFFARNELPALQVWERAAYYYDASNQLRTVDRQTCTGNWQASTVACGSPDSQLRFVDRGAFEEYRYDALGRRILVRTRSDKGCDRNDCDRSIRRIVWDGDQVLYEIRYPAPTAVLPAQMERDTGFVDGGTDNVGAYGRVIYTQGGATDKPLSIIRIGYSTLWRDAFTLIPQYSWRGMIDGASLPNGHQATDPSGSIISEMCRNAGAGNDCVVVDWPAANHQLGFILPQLEAYIAPRGWMGSLPTLSRDGSGQMYRRNRYYDPQSGRFTQEDPIGLAGGVNAYGFAAGDPVNYSDPFGLCPIPPWDCPDAVLRYTARWGDQAVDDWAEMSESSSGTRKGGAVVMGHFAALWTTQTYDKTLHVLRTGWEMGRDAVRNANASGPNQMDRDPRKPRTVDRVDPAFPGSGDAQPHIHFHRFRYTLNRDGTWGHGADNNNPPQLTGEEKGWVESHGWRTRPKDQ